MPLNKLTQRRIKRIQEMRFQLENLRKEMVADAVLMPPALDTAFLQASDYLDNLSGAIHKYAST